MVEAVTAPEELVDLVREGVWECAENLGGTSASFALPAWQKWAKLLTDRRDPKGWPTVFADGRRLATRTADGLGRGGAGRHERRAPT